MKYHTFPRWWAYQLKTYDCDPAMHLLTYAADHCKLDEEQRWWLAWLYGNTYQPATAWAIFKHFPFYRFTHPQTLGKWAALWAHNLPYQKDARWSRGNLEHMLASYQETVGDSQECFFRNVDFPEVWGMFVGQRWFYRFGRFSAWNFLQAARALTSSADHLVPDRLDLRHPSAAQPRRGLALAVGEVDWAARDHKFTPYELEYLEAEAARLIEEMRQRWAPPAASPVQIDAYTLETALCSYAKLHRRQRGRYLGYYLDRATEDINRVADAWAPFQPNMLSPLMGAMIELPYPDLVAGEVRPDLYATFLDTGNFRPDGCATESQLNIWWHEEVFNGA